MTPNRRSQLITVARTARGAVHKSWAWAAGGQPECHDRGRAPGRPKSTRQRDAGGDRRTIDQALAEGGSLAMLSDLATDGQL